MKKELWLEESVLYSMHKGVSRREPAMEIGSDGCTTYHLRTGDEELTEQAVTWITTDPAGHHLWQMSINDCRSLSPRLTRTRLATNAVATASVWWCEYQIRLLMDKTVKKALIMKQNKNG
jgi:hypothetical protein